MFSVSVLSSMDTVSNTWAMSKPPKEGVHQIEEKELLKMQLPTSGFLEYCLRIKSSILFRDLLFTVRPINPWAKSFRNIKYNSSTLKLSNEIEMYEGNGAKILQEKIEDCISRVANGEAPDTVKQDLPILTETEYDVILSFRTIVNFLYTLEKEVPQYFAFVFDAFSNALSIDKEFYLEIKKSSLIERLKLTKEELAFDGFQKMLSINAIFKTIQCNLASQFLRQHTAIVKNELWNIAIRNFQQLFSMTCKDSIKVGAYLTDDAVRYLLSKRCCWFAQFDDSNTSSWDYILGDVVSSMNITDFKRALPCNGCSWKCDVKADMLSRAQRLDINPPCPICLENPELMKIRKAFYGKTSRILEKWEQLCSTMPLNIDNELSKLYFEKENRDVL